MTEPAAQRFPLRTHRLQHILTRIHRDALLCVYVVLLSTVVALFVPLSHRAQTIAIGSIGDRMLLSRSSGTGGASDGRWFADELAPGASHSRSRWSQKESHILLPVGNVGSVHIEIAGWPTTQQPNVTVAIDNQTIGSFTPGAGFEEYQFSVSDLASAQSHELRILTSDVLTDTREYTDPRQKGVRVAAVTLAPPEGEPYTYPFWPIFTWYFLILSTVSVVSSLLLRTELLRYGVVALGAFGGNILASSAGLWIATIPPALLVAGLALHLSLHSKLLLRVFWGIWVRMQRQRLAVHCGVIAGIGCLAFLAYDSPVASIARIVVLSGGITWLIDRVGVRRQLLRFDLYAPLVRRVVSVGFYLTVTACVVWSMQHAPFIGHADYADNVVVARNLIRGRGWVVDYVTQFYQIYPSVTHPQETWPILQPVWIALSFVFFGVTDSAARVPNLVFWVLLAWLVGRFARHRWGMTVALVSVAILSMNVFMYRQIIYATSDIAFVAFATAAFQGIWMLPQAEQTYWRNGWFRSFRAKSLATGVWTGLMLLQKPGSAAMLALGMGFWLLLTWVVPLFRAHMDWQALWRRLGYVIIWAGIACSVLMPYIVRNLILFGSAVHSTESYDAWILEYTQWDAIYRVYAADGGIGSGDLPERSWLLRWGFDALLHKFWMQGKVIQDYLLPSFVAFPWPFNAFGGAATATGMLSAFGLWCAVIGMLPPRTNKRVALWRMLLFCMLPYTIFMVTYWHANEPRYWVVLLPWLALAAGHGIVRVRDVLLRERQYPFFRGLLVSTAVVCALYSPVSSIRSSMLVDAALVVADRDLYQYLRTNTSPDAVMMTRVPWQLQWYSDRGAVMIPSDADATTILRIAKHYGARYLVLDSLQRPNAATRAVLTEMIAAPGSGFVLRYRTPAYPVDDRGRRFTMVSEVYEFPLDYQGVPPIW